MEILDIVLKKESLDFFVKRYVDSTSCSYGIAKGFELKRKAKFTISTNKRNFTLV